MLICFSVARGTSASFGMLAQFIDEKHLWGKGRKHKTNKTQTLNIQSDTTQTHKTESQQNTK